MVSQFRCSSHAQAQLSLRIPYKGEFIIRQHTSNMDCPGSFVMLLSVVIGALFIQSMEASPIIESNSYKHNAQVVNYQMDTENMPNSYKFHYDADDGSSRTEEGSILNPGTKDAALDVLGTVRWYDNKGQLYEMTYKAGKRGYRTIIKKVHR